MPAWEQDVRVLRAAVEAIDDDASGTGVKLLDLATATGLTIEQVLASIRALVGARLIEVRSIMAAAGQLSRVQSVSGEARRLIGQWPSADNFVERLLDTLDERIDETPAGEERTRLQKIRDSITGVSRDLFVDVAGAVISRTMGGG